MARHLHQDNVRRSGLPIWAVALIAAVIALLVILGYDLLMRKHERDERSQITRDVAMQVESTRVEQQNRAVQQALHGERLQDAMTSSAMLRTMVTEYLAAMVKLPGSIEELGIAPGEVHMSNSIESFDVLANGVIVLNLSAEKIGKKGRLVLTPEVRDNTITGWSCSTADYSDIHQFLPNCKYKDS